MSKIRHVLGISGGKDSAALAIYLRQKFPTLDIEYYTSDTGKELDETYRLIERLEVYLGKPIIRLSAANRSTESPFDHFLKMYGGYLPSSNSRWCTKKLKLEPFERFVGNDPVVSYVGIRADENREGYISHKTNIQSIFPFRKNIWSEDVIAKVFANENMDFLISILETTGSTFKLRETFRQILLRPITPAFSRTQKLDSALQLSTPFLNNIIFEYLKGTSYPLARVGEFPLLEKEEGLIRSDIFNLLEKSGVGIPEYYNEIPFDVYGKTGMYARSRSGCFFCFFQQKIEWIWLYEQHPELFSKALEYEKDGYTWMQDETLLELIRDERKDKVKFDFIKKMEKQGIVKKDWKEVLLEDAEEEGCASCFI